MCVAQQGSDSIGSILEHPEDYDIKQDKISIGHYKSDLEDCDLDEDIKEDFEKAGFKLTGLEGDQFDMSPIKLGLPNRDEWIEKYQQMLRNMGKLGVNLLCLNWMVSVGWFRSSVETPIRGGAMTTSFDYSKTPAQLDDPSLMKTPIVRNGKQATVGFCPEIWVTWE